MPAKADSRDRPDGNWPAELCKYACNKNDGAKKGICGLSKPWHDEQAAAMAFAGRRAASRRTFDGDLAAGNFPCDLVWNAGGFFTAQQLVYDLSLYAGSIMGGLAPHFAPGSGCSLDVLPVDRKRKHYRAFADR